MGAPFGNKNAAGKHSGRSKTTVKVVRTTKRGKRFRFNPTKPDWNAFGNSNISYSFRRKK